MVIENRRKYNKVYHGEHRSEILLRQNAYFKAHREENRLRCIKWYELHRKEELIKRREKRDLIRKKFISMYGGKCSCCGETIEQFLSLDHINSNGKEHRMKVRGGAQMYRLVIKEGYRPDKYRILCYNCNLSRGFYGFCPHERNKDENS